MSISPSPPAEETPVGPPPDPNAYRGSLERGSLRRAGRIKLDVRNPSDARPTDAQRAAWRAFWSDVDAIEADVAEALLRVYREQRPERLRWWELVYGDSPDAALPEVADARAMRHIVRPTEVVADLPRDGETVTIRVEFESRWHDKDIEVGVSDGRVLGVREVPHWEGRSSRPAPETINSPAFGRLQREGFGSGVWGGTFHSPFLRGYRRASRTRHEFRKHRETYERMPRRPGPSWRTITGEVGLTVFAERSDFPTAEQEGAFRRFTAEPAEKAWGVLLATFEWYERKRPTFLKRLRGTREEKAAALPELQKPEHLLEMIELSSITICEPPTAEELAPRTQVMPFGPNAGKPFTIPAKRPGVAILLNFAWHDEHGLGVRWRDGEVEAIGNWESVYEH